MAEITGKLGESTGSPQASFPMHSVNAAPLALPGLAVFALMVHPVATIVGIGNVKGKEHDSRMSIVNVRFRSEALGKQTGFNVIHPDKGDGPFPVLMQLHGYSDDSFAWLYNSNLVRHVADLPLIVVLPDGGTSRYVNTAPHERFNLQRYEDLSVEEIPAELGRTFHVRPGPWAIGGLSMGGQGALRIGMKHSDQFASIWAHSAGGL
ncbi:MAG: hypothetical protein H0T72_11360, partial [Chloroflexia bacterium]|nr:hypothetical protein [Chloroflexia bacterium]